jgi:hypothetical protein
LLCGFFAAVSRPPPVASFSLCDLRLFVIKRIYRAPVQPGPETRPGSGAGPSSGTVSGPGAGPGYSAGSGGRLRTSLRFLLTHIQQPTFSFILPAYLLCKVRKARWTAVLSSYESLFCAACSRVSNCRPLQCFASPPLTIFERRNLFPWPAISEKWSRLGFLKCAGPSHRARSRRIILPFNLTSLILSSI